MRSSASEIVRGENAPVSSGSFSEFLVLQIVGCNEPKQCVTEKKRVLAIVEAPGHFVKVSGKMLRRNTMPCSHNPALEKREGGLHGVCVDVTLHVDASLVFDAFVLHVGHPGSFHRERVSRKFVG